MRDRRGVGSAGGRRLGWCVAILAAALATAQPATPPTADANPSPPTVEAATDWTERLFRNPRERSAVSRRAFEDGDFQDAVEPARTARRLAPDDPVTALNLGSALLGAGQPEEALEPLTKAAESLEARYAERPSRDRARLTAGAHYNRGNALFAAGDLEGAVSAYEQALRRAPEHQDAKFNLELALRQQQNQQQQQQGEDGQQEDGSQEPEAPDDSEGEGEDQPQGSSQDPSEPQEGENDGQEQPEDGGEQQPEEPPEEEDGEQPGEPEPQGQGDGRPEESRLPQFEDQPDMTAEEAAAILEAVENLEREQRQEEAELRARQRTPKEKDW